MKDFFRGVLIIVGIAVPCILVAWFIFSGNHGLESLGDWFLGSGIGLFLLGMSIAGSESRGAGQMRQQYADRQYTSEYANRPIHVHVPLRTMGLFTVASGILIAIAVVMLAADAQKAPNAVEPTRAPEGARGSP